MKIILVFLLILEKFAYSTIRPEGNNCLQYSLACGYTNYLAFNFNTRIKFSNKIYTMPKPKKGIHISPNVLILKQSRNANIERPNFYIIIFSEM